jgi:hypothetical protein
MSHYRRKQMDELCKKLRFKWVPTQVAGTHLMAVLCALPSQVHELLQLSDSNLNYAASAACVCCIDADPL